MFEDSYKSEKEKPEGKESIIVCFYAYLLKNKFSS